jgi:phosphoribosylformylglycinamidine cyclo-ligase
VDELGQTLGDCLMTPTKIYVKAVLSALAAARVKSAAHITGGGFFENIPRSLPKGLGAKIDVAALKTPPIFRLVQSTGEIATRDMFNTFNMGVGMTLTVAPDEADKALAALCAAGEEAYVLGEIVRSEEGVVLA